MISLAIGLSTSITIGILVYSDLTFDTFHKDSDRIYRVTSNFKFGNKNSYSRGVPVPLYDVLKNDVKGIELASFFYTGRVSTAKTEIDEYIFKNVSGVIFTDKNYFQLIKYKWIHGSEKLALEEPNQIVLTKTRAQKYFPNLRLDLVVGKTMTYNDSITIRVSGIVDDLNKRTDFTFQEFISLKSSKQFNANIRNDEWDSTSSNSQIFIKRSKNTSSESIENQLATISKTYIDVKTIQYNRTQSLLLQPLSDLHFNAAYHIFGSSTWGAVDKSSLLALSGIALFILLLGCVNFINLNTAQATKRSTEVGVQKTLGASKKQVRIQMFGEMIIMTFFATVLSVVFAGILLGIFKDFAPNGISLSLFKDPFIIGTFILLFMLVSFLSGFYPAIILSKFKPSEILRNKNSSGRQSTRLRKYLTVFQFTIAQIFILGTILVGGQIHYLMNRDMGFQKDAIAYLYAPYNEFTIDKNKRFVKELEAIPSIKSVSLSIFISCLGLLGLVIHTTQVRAKEIGIRKVLGQKSSQIIFLLSKDFMKLTGISILIGMPIAYLFFKDWISEFAYRVPITGFYFILAALLTCVTALLTVIGQTIIASKRNPTETLKE